MMAMVLVVLIVVLVLGLSVGGLDEGKGARFWTFLWRHFLTAVCGLGIATMITILGVILVWPPHDYLGNLLLLGFVVLMAGICLFIRATLTGQRGREGSSYRREGLVDQG